MKRHILITGCIAMAFATVSCSPGGGAAIQRGEWVTIKPSDGPPFKFAIQEFAGYRSEDLKDPLSGRAEAVVVIAHVTGEGSIPPIEKGEEIIQLDIAKANATAHLRDGSAKGLRALKIVDMKGAHYLVTEKVNTVSGNPPAIRPAEVVHGEGNIGIRWTGQDLTDALGLSSNEVYTLTISGTNTLLTLSLFFDAVFPDVKSIAVFGKTMK